MQLTDIFLRLGEESFGQLMRSVSLGRLRTYQLFDSFRTRLRLHKLNSETLRNATPRIWARLREEGSGDLASELSQAILISHMDMIKAVLDDLGVPHEEGFFSKDAQMAGHLTEGWQQRVWEKFQSQYPRITLLFYINHLALEVAKAEDLFAPAA